MHINRTVGSELLHHFNRIISKVLLERGIETGINSVDTLLFTVAKFRYCPMSKLFVAEFTQEV